jgi:hypothetical protein
MLGISRLTLQLNKYSLSPLSFREEGRKDTSKERLNSRFNPSNRRIR